MTEPPLIVDNLSFKYRTRPELAIEHISFQLKPGEFSGLVQSDFGFHIIKVEEKAERSYQSYDDVKEMLKKSALIEKKRKAVDEYVEKLSKEAGVEIDVSPLFGGQMGPHTK